MTHVPYNKMKMTVEEAAYMQTFHTHDSDLVTLVAAALSNPALCDGDMLDSNLAEHGMNRGTPTVEIAAKQAMIYAQAALGEVMAYRLKQIRFLGLAEPAKIKA